MNESDYWLALEFRLTREFAGMADERLRFLWCDGFTPEEFLVTDATPRIDGQVWICNGPKQEQWSFTLLLPHRLNSLDEIEWDSLLPGEHVTRWIGIDPTRKHIEIEPAGAVEDIL